MQIGKFARICNTKISVLRHYDKEGLLVPDYIDRFTGYRYYSSEQISIFLRITALKRAGFTLSEIKDILKNMHSDADILDLFEKKKREIALVAGEIVAGEVPAKGCGAFTKAKLQQTHSVCHIL